MRRFFLALCFLLLAIPAQAQLYGYTSVLTPANPTGTTDTTGKMMGLGADASAPCVVNVQKTGAVLFIIQFSASNGTAGDGFAAQLRYGTGTAPANAAAPAGTTVGAFRGSSNTATVVEDTTIIGVARGLTLGSLYWFDVALKAVTGGTATMTSVTCQAVELAN